MSIQQQVSIEELRARVGALETKVEALLLSVSQHAEIIAELKRDNDELRRRPVNPSNRGR